ncbi:MAG TPA: hypothetical protein VK864_04365, partial [Longimicrobiales bacterium]|nr:hypothetical protein [Longimicrobiales bacterium]
MIKRLQLIFGEGGFIPLELAQRVRPPTRTNQQLEQRVLDLIIGGIPVGGFARRLDRELDPGGCLGQLTDFGEHAPEQLVQALALAVEPLLVLVRFGQVPAIEERALIQAQRGFVLVAAYRVREVDYVHGHGVGNGHAVARDREPLFTHLLAQLVHGLAQDMARALGLALRPEGADQHLAHAAPLNGQVNE